jgi:hypothetical protein
LYTIWVKPEQSIPNGVLPPKDKERLNIKMKCLSGAFVFNTSLLCFLQIQTTSVYGVVIDKRKRSSRGMVAN